MHLEHVTQINHKTQQLDFLPLKNSDSNACILYKLLMLSAKKADHLACPPELQQTQMHTFALARAFFNHRIQDNSMYSITPLGHRSSTSCLVVRLLC